eukprot:CAMPEP_0113943536 /NCGR_PEP_ID=MMETSP1339-20121228/25794_1 /TAXON_ID=94617 /ORGANISM="Fibrocapsa japonica" /LENGTH=352 /DNA_ID=CAMNT_0000948437 /DNA_START=33 /DNA_END=1094 /DNA_ORIENTATION=+ /assembly_acc=CAM_ASM_000762
MVILAAVEGGGTTWRAALAKDSPENITESKVFETTDQPQEVLAKIRAWLDERKFDSLGIATFGPLDPKEGSPTWGYITYTPKPGWKDTDVVGALWDGSVPVKFDTDVNPAALAEYRFNNPAGTSSCAYITVGTGVGVGLVVNGKVVHGLLHPEAGHIPWKHLEKDTDSFAGSCAWHGDCVEGTCSTPAIESYSGVDRKDLKDLPDDHPVWDRVGRSLGSACATLALVASPERIVISGGVMNRTILYQKIREQALACLNGYLKHPLLTKERIEEYICPSKWGQRAGTVGALTLSLLAWEEGNAPDTVSVVSASKKCCKCPFTNIGINMVHVVVGGLAAVGLVALVTGRMSRSS